MKHATHNRRALIFASLTLLLGSVAQAQTVRKCQIDGRLVFQASPCPIDARVASAEPQPTVAAATPVAPKKKTLAELLRDRDGVDRGLPQAREAQGDGANVLRSRMGAV